MTAPRRWRDPAGLVHDQHPEPFRHNGVEYDHTRCDIVVNNSGAKVQLVQALAITPVTCPICLFHRNLSDGTVLYRDPRQNVNHMPHDYTQSGNPIFMCGMSASFFERKEAPGTTGNLCRKCFNAFLRRK